MKSQENVRMMLFIMMPSFSSFGSFSATCRCYSDTSTVCRPDDGRKPEETFSEIYRYYFGAAMNQKSDAVETKVEKCKREEVSALGGLASVMLAS